MQDLGIIVDTEYSPPNWIPPPIASMFRECFLVPKTAYVHFQVVGPSRINIGGQELGKVDGRKRLIELTEIAKTHGFDSVVFARINDFIEFGERPDIVHFLPEPDSKANYFTPPEAGQSHEGMVDSSGKAVDYSFEGVGIPSTDLSFAS